MKKIVFATNNRHKLEEIRKIAEGQLEILSLSDIGCNEEIDETGSTLDENAMIKAAYVQERYGYDCFADDTGLEVEALQGAPGVFSARYAGEACRAEDNMDKLLAEMSGHDHRNARFRTVIALICDGEVHLFEGVINGTITREKKGNDGFGYDPLFVPEGDTHTFAELGNEVKNSISHRALATEKLMKFLLEKTQSA
ncbi:MAG: non-canonical purine NTP diphosphatase [Proteiniphilum sp.]|nr:non-canonical purine NTP diphosphatase [Proteiniphilum sp.]MDD4799981.1 non-canonical purine NTP diphosphatase [Proteiniphilum sp.]